MRLKIIVLLFLTLASGYAVQFCFNLMNQQSDVLYPTGVVALIGWVLLAGMAIEYMFFHKKRKTNEEVPVVPPVSTPVPDLGGLHDKDRSRDGGN